MKDNTMVLVVGAVCLTAVAVISPDVALRYTVVGALAGLLGGHLNGRQNPQG